MTIKTTIGIVCPRQIRTTVAEMSSFFGQQHGAVARVRHVHITWSFHCSALVYLIILPNRINDKLFLSVFYLQSLADFG